MRGEDKLLICPQCMGAQPMRGADVQLVDWRDLRSHWPAFLRKPLLTDTLLPEGKIRVAASIPLAPSPAPARTSGLAAGDGGGPAVGPIKSAPRRIEQP